MIVGHQTTLKAKGATIECSLVPWDTELFGFAVAQVTGISLSRSGEADAVLEHLDRWCAKLSVRLVSCRLDHDQLRESMALEAAGFRFIEMVFGPRLEHLDGVGRPGLPIRLTEAGPHDMPDIEAIAHEAFTTGRFLLDWRLPAELSKRRYASWVRNDARIAGQYLLKVEHNGEIVGFFVAETRPDRGVYWHLTAIAPTWQGRGIGRSAWRAALLRHRDEGAAYVETTVSAHNAAVMNLYAGLGFAFGKPRMTFHWMRGGS